MNESRPATTGSDGLSGVGAALREARERAGLSHETLAHALKVSERRLLALEAEQWDEFPDIVFLRAFAASVCRHLGIDREPILAALPAAAAVELTPDDSRLGPFHDDPGGRRRRWVALSGLRRGGPLFAGAIALAVAGLALWFWPHAGHDDGMGERQTPAGSLPTAPSVAGLPAEHATVAPSRAAAPLPSPTTSAASASTLPSAPAAAVTSSATPATPVASGASDALASRTLRFTATGETWVEVTAANGTVVYRKLLQPGEVALVDAPGPVQVLVGRADATTVSVGGRPFDLAAVARNNVARFEVR